MSLPTGPEGERAAPGGALRGARVPDTEPGGVQDTEPGGVQDTEPVRDVAWQRLDRRMLLVHPVREVGRFLPALIALLVAGSAVGLDLWYVLGIAAPVTVGLLRYLTTRFRIAAGRVELRTGLVSRHTLSTRVDRVRTVDLTSTPVQRVLGLTTVRLGTGTAAGADGDRGLDLDGLPVGRARALREELLRRAAPAYDPRSRTGADEPDLASGDPAPEPASSQAGSQVGSRAASQVHGGREPERVVARFEPRWLLYAPLTSSGFLMVAGIAGVGSQVANQLDPFDRLDRLPVVGRLVGDSVGDSLGDFFGALAWWVLVPVLVVVALLAVAVLAVAGYALTNGGLRLSRRDDTWHLSRGLLTTRETTLDADRMRGVVVGAPLGIRLARGRRLSAVMTGLNASRAGSAVLVPPAPAAVVEQAAAAVLGTPAPLDVPLVPHGPRARTRRFVRALVPAGLLAAALAGIAASTDLPRWPLAVVVPLLLAAAVGLAADRARALGHALVDRWYVVRSGSLLRRRVVLDRATIIGWNLTSTWFQRRAGLVTLVATTAGGDQSYAAVDVPERLAVPLAATAVPGLLEQFLEDREAVTGRRSMSATVPGTGGA